MRSDSANAGLYLVIGTAVQSNVRQYEGLVVSGEFAGYGKTGLQNFNTRALQALGSDAAMRLAILGEVALECQCKVSELWRRNTGCQALARREALRRA